MRNKFLKSLKVLLVEDEKKLSSLLKNAIGSSFKSFLIANDGKEGLEVYRNTSPDIIITDIMMPNKTGLEMAKEIKDIDSNANIIILSAFSEVDKLLTAIDVGVIKYFIKPFDPDELLEYIISLEENIAKKQITLKDGFMFNKSTKSLYKGTKYVKLSKKETLFLELLIKDYEDGNLIVSYENIKNNLWDETVSDERLRTFIRRFRDKTSKELLENLKGQGYKISIIS